METLFSIVLYIIYGFFGLLLLLFVLAVLFGKRIKKQWEYEAKFKLRHDSLEAGQMVQVYLDDLLVMQGNAAQAGRIYLRNDAVVNEVNEPRKGQICRVVYGGREQFSAPIRPD